jgi:hypothetical protein
MRKKEEKMNKKTFLSLVLMVWAISLTAVPASPKFYRVTAVE